MNELYVIQWRAIGSTYESSWELYKAYGSRDSAEYHIQGVRGECDQEGNEFRIVRYVRG